MRFRHLVWKELWHRKLGTLLILIGIVVCVGLIVSMQVRTAIAVEKVSRDMLRAGRNILIFPKGLTLYDYRKGEFGNRTLPQSDVSFLAKPAATGELPARRFLGSLQRRTLIQGEELVLAGLTGEQDPLATAADKQAAAPRLEIGQADVGSDAARRLGMDPKEPAFVFLGKPPQFTRLKVRNVLAPTGTVQDAKVFVDITVAQKYFGTGQVINVIEAMSLTSAASDLKALEDEIGRRLAGENQEPRVNVYHRVALATGRARAETSIRRNTALLSGLALIFGMLIIGSYSVLSARARRREMGILLAIAARRKHVVWIFLEKMLILGVIGGVLGCWFGGMVGLRNASQVTTELRSLVWQTYGVALGLAVVLTVLPSLGGVYVASRTDPAETLREL